MKKTIIFLAFLALAYFGFRYVKRKKSETGPGLVNPSGPVRKYRKLNRGQVDQMARTAVNALPSMIVTPEAKTKLLGDFLSLQKESLQAVARQVQGLSPLGTSLSDIVKNAVGVPENLRVQVLTTLEKIA